MFFKSLAELINIIKNTDTAIIVLRDGDKIGDKVFEAENLKNELKNLQIIEPGVKKNASGKPINSITIEQIREVISACAVKQQKDVYFIFKNAEKMQEAAENASLKLFEEPKKKYHFVLLTSSPEALLPTIRSRAAIYAPLRQNSLEMAPEAEKEVFMLAKRLLVADNDAVLEIAEELSKKKDTEKCSKRDFALEVIKTTIELAEKSYFKTENEAFTKKINGLILAFNAISKNGNLKLQLIANLV